MKRTPSFPSVRKGARRGVHTGSLRKKERRRKIFIRSRHTLRAVLCGNCHPVGLLAFDETLDDEECFLIIERVVGHLNRIETRQPHQCGQAGDPVLDLS